VEDGHPVLLCQPLRDERSVTSLRVALDAEERRLPIVRQLRQQGAEVGRVQDLADEAVTVLAGELGAGAFSDPEPVVLRVLHAAQLGRRRELEPVTVADARLGQRCLQPLRVRPGVLAAADAAALADVDDEADVVPPERLQERLERPPVDADRRDVSGRLRQDSG
jgi:hypothetical protein